MNNSDRINLKKLSLVRWLIFIGISLFVNNGCAFAQSQIVPDNTLGSEASQVRSNGEVEGVPAELIEGGASRGTNLFHSFQEFNVEEGQRVDFANPTGIDNILTRITGSNISNILGTLGVNGSADLFLINPNGIIFGEGAQLDISGSFLGSTASSILFEGAEFSATDIENPPLLTINAPIGLGLEANPGEIVNRSSVQDSEGIPIGLEVSTKNNLSLVGGNIKFEGGQATARGKVELGGLLAAGTVGISEDGSLTFPDNVTKADITLSNGALVDVRGSGGGITVNADNLGLTANSFLEAGIAADSTSNNAQTGGIVINLTDNLTLDNSRIINLVGEGGVGNSGNINITASSIEIINGGLIDTSTFGQGNAGLIDITALDTISIDGEDSNQNSSRISSRVDPGAVGNAEGVAITTDNLSVTGWWIS